MTDYITTYTGKHFYPMKPNPEDICIEDIAHALSLICRGNGQLHTFYSVGEHSINCALEAKARGYSDRIMIGALLHDASESYMSDVPRPFKQFLKDYQEIEEHLLKCIFEKFLGSDLTVSEYKKIKEIDNAVLAYDLCYLLNEGEKDQLPPLKRSYYYGKKTFSDVEKEFLDFFQKADVLKKFDNS